MSSHKVTVMRSAKTGRFVTKKFAQRYPKTTFKDTVKK
jgi:hypothetical protein